MRSLIRFTLGMGLGWLATAFTALPSLSAERITFFYPPFGQFSVATKDLEIFAKEGRVTDELAFYTRRATPEQLAVVQDLLRRRFQMSPATVANVAYSPFGENVLRRLGEVFQTQSKQNGFSALRAAAILAAADREGLTVMNLLRRFPLETIRLDLTEGQQVFGELSQLFKEKNLLFSAIQQQAVKEAAEVDFSALPDLRLPGQINWRKETLNVTNPNRRLSFPADIYLPQGNLTPAPLVVISHGVASDRNSFAYLAQHLVSYGFAVAVLEHPNTSATETEQFLSGFAPSADPVGWVNRPLDVKYLLDELEQKSQSDANWRGQMNLQQVGVLGHSLGGYTVLALAGAKPNFAQLRQRCSQIEPSQALNLAVLLQCRATDLPLANANLQDPRVKAVLAINPVTSTIFGQEGLSQIQVPLMMVAGTEDYFTPPVPEQILPFTWLTTPNKYLVLTAGGTHFSFLGGEGQEALPSSELIGPDPALARPSMDALSTAFFKTHLANQPEYRPYLNQSYVSSISQSPFALSLVQSLKVAQPELARR